MRSTPNALCGACVALLLSCAGGDNGTPDAEQTADADAGAEDLGVDIGPDAEPSDADRDLAADVGGTDVPDVDPQLMLRLAAASDRPGADPSILSGIARVTAEVDTDAPGDLLGVEFFVDGFRIDTDLIPPYNVSFNTAAYADGTHAVTAFTADRRGRSAEAELSLQFDNSPPEVLTHAPEEGAALFFEDGPLAMRVTLDDDDVVERVTFRANGLLVGETFAPPFEATAEWDALFIDADALPANVFVQIEVIDNLGQRALVDANIKVYERAIWTFETLGEIWSAAQLLPDGNIVFANKNNRVTALTPSGVEAWSVGSTGAIDMAPAVDPASGRVFVGTGAGLVHAYDPGGRQAWQSDIRSPPGGDLAFHEGTVVVAGFDGTVHGLRASDGASLWSVPLPDQVLAAPTIADDGTVYIGCQDTRIYAIRGGAIVWSVETGDEVWSQAAIGPAGTIYIGSNDGWLYAIDPDGETRWSTEIEGQMWGRVLLTDDGGLFVGSTSRFVHRIDPLSGAPLWRTRTEGLTNSSPVSGPSGELYIATTLGNVFAIEPERGEVLWTFPLMDAVHAPPLLIDDRLYIGSTGRTMHALRVAAPAEDVEP